MLTLTTFDLDDVVVHSVRAGAGGFLLKTASPPPPIIAAVHDVDAGRGALSAARVWERSSDSSSP